MSCGIDHGVAWFQSCKNAPASRLTAAASSKTIPSSRLSSSDDLVKFSEPTKAVLPSANRVLAWM